MNSRILVIFGVLGIWAPAIRADVSLGDANVLFATQTEGKRLLMTKDDFVRRLSPFDRAARLKVGRSVSEDEFLEFVGAAVLDWTKEEMESVQAAFEGIRPVVREMSVSFPSVIQIIKTTGKEEGNAAYTRGAAIVLPATFLAKGREELKRLVCHELFHVLSRQNPELRERLYGVIGFKKCDEVKLPVEMDRRRITNPDAPRNDHFIRIKIEGDERRAVPILLSTVEQYDPKRGGEFFEYLQLKLLILPESADSQDRPAASPNGSIRLVGLEQVSGFAEQVGRNTDYIIHPEEILADNFALLVLNQREIPSPEIVDKIRDLLGHKTKLPVE